jgi:hypothetical protein
MRWRDERVIQHRDPRGEKCAIIAVGYGENRQNAQHDWHGVHRLGSVIYGSIVRPSLADSLVRLQSGPQGS